LNLGERFSGWLKIREWAAGAIPAEPHTRERRLIESGMLVGFAVSSIWGDLTEGRWLGVVFWTAIGIYAGYRAMALSSFGYRFIDSLLNQSTRPRCRPWRGRQRRPAIWARSSEDFAYHHEETLQVLLAEAGIVDGDAIAQSYTNKKSLD
jgi:hypothetical protein